MSGPASQEYVSHCAPAHRVSYTPSHGHHTGWHEAHALYSAYDPYSHRAQGWADDNTHHPSQRMAVHDPRSAHHDAGYAPARQGLVSHSDPLLSSPMKRYMMEPHAPGTGDIQNMRLHSPMKARAPMYTVNHKFVKQSLLLFQWRPKILI